VTPASGPRSAPLASGRASFLRGFRLIPRLETYPAVLSFAQTIPGKLALLGIFGVGLWYTHPRWWALIFLLAVITALPQYRRIMLTCGTLLWTFGAAWRSADRLLLADIGAVLILAALLFWSATRFPDSYFGRRPVACLLAGLAFVVLLASYLPRGGQFRALSWEFLAVFATYVWFIAYSLLDSRSKSSDPFSLQLGTYRPFWGSTNTPFVKGAAYLRRIEAQNPEQLAIAQLKGLKLLAWSIVLDLLMGKIFAPVVHGCLGIPLYTQLFALSVQRAPFPWYLAWGSLIANFLERLASLAIVGHQIVAACRMAGFLALRNTYRPLEAYSIAEFWNRYYYYFKELLVDCFFYPTFMRYFKGRGQWRLFAATFAAAGFGNAFFHFFRDLHYIQELGFCRALAGFHTYIFYTTVLSLGIGISQVRKRGPRSTDWFRGRFVPAFCVISFFCIFSVFDYTDNNRYPIQECFRFLAHLFNLVS
jgi:hypothetical protein